MKKKFVKGHPLTENELKEVKGGAWYAIKVVTPPYDKPTSIICDCCDTEIEKFEPNGQENTYVAICHNCGCRKEVKKEE